MSPCDTARLPDVMEGNVFLGVAKPSKHEIKPLVKPQFDPALKLVQKSDGLYLKIRFDRVWSAERTRKLVTTALLGKPVISNLPYQQPDGSPLCVDTDYFGGHRNAANPTPGPFENPGQGELVLKVR